MPKNELELFHVREEKKRFDDRNFAVSTTCVLQKYNIREWGVSPNERQWDYYERMRTSESGYDYTILYNPREKEVEKEPEAGEAEEKEVIMVEEPAETPAPKPAKKSKKEKETISL